MPHPPALPLITHDVLPGEGWFLGDWKVARKIPLYNSWHSDRHVITKLQAGTLVTALESLNIVHRPDVIVTTESVPELRLNTGDKFSRYRGYGEGTYDFWANGCWYKESSVAVKNASGSGFSKFVARETEPGQKSWWFKLQLADGTVGWSDAFLGLNPLRPAAKKK